MSSIWAQVRGCLLNMWADCDAPYTGIDISRKMVRKARQRHSQHGRFLKGDTRHLERVAGLHPASFDAAVYLLSIEDMNPLETVIRSTAWALKPGGRVVILMRHPCFRVPRQSGWGDDKGRKLRYRRVDSYLTPLSVPMKPYEHNQSGVTISFHRPLSAYINSLAAHNLMIDYMDEIITHNQGQGKAERRANAEIPLFLALRARGLAD